MNFPILSSLLTNAFVSRSDVDRASPMKAHNRHCLKQHGYKQLIARIAT
jgi:hypothetical protein